MQVQNRVYRERRIWAERIHRSCLERSAADRGGTAVDILARQGRDPGPNLGDTTCAADIPRKKQRVAPVKSQNSIIGDISSNASSRTAVAKLERASNDRGAGDGTIPRQC
jgi:hypothetical protein